MTRLVILFLLVACGRPAPSKLGLVTHCSSSAECKSDSSGCVYCYNGQCSCTLPAEPKDAGVDAPGPYL